MMNTFCPFINGDCRSDCVFHIRKTTADKETLTVCRLVSSAGVSEILCDTLLEEKEKYQSDR